MQGCDLGATSHMCGKCYGTNVSHRAELYQDVEPKVALSVDFREVPPV
jgi:hypothetical protein